MPKNVIDYSLRPIDGASILLITSGKGSITSTSLQDALQLYRGQIVFIAANETVQVTDISEDLMLFRAYCQLN